MHGIRCEFVAYLFDPVDYILNQKFVFFFTCMLINFMVRMVQLSETQIFYYSANENIQKTVLKSRIEVSNKKVYKWF